MIPTNEPTNYIIPLKEDIIEFRLLKYEKFG